MTTSSDSSRVHWSFSLLPVQEWIAAARRSRDLLAGSRLLSWWVARAVAALAERGEVRLVSPAMELAEVQQRASLGPRDLFARDAYSLTNRVSGSFAGLGLEEARRALAGLDGVIRSAWQELVDALGDERSVARVWRAVEAECGEARCPVGVVWCARRAPAAEEPAQAAERLDELFAAAKRWRPVAPWEGAPVRKCGQCGDREALGGETRRRLDSMDEVRKGLRLEAEELLCPVCVVKRFAGYLGGEAFPSTSSLASAPWRRRVEANPRLRPAFEAWRSAAEAFAGSGPASDVDPLLYPPTVERLVSRCEDGEEREQLGAVRDGLTELRAAIESEHRRRAAAGGAEELPRPEPPSYLAALVFDGDSIGEAVHRRPDEVPPRMDAFGRAVTDSLGRRDDARAFYVGGDEGLVLSAAAPALGLAHGIRALWRREVADEPGGEGLTLSMGICLFHRESPLGAALGAAREALAEAKAMDGKDALAVTVRAAAGSRWTAVERWGADWERLEQAVQLTAAGRLSRGWAYDVEEFLRPLPEEAWRKGPEGRRAIRDEVRRITGRRCAAGEGGRREAAEAVWRELDGDGWWEETPKGLATLPEQLHLVGFLAGQADPGPPAAPAREEGA